MGKPESPSMGNEIFSLIFLSSIIFVQSAKLNQTAAVAGSSIKDYNDELHSFKGNTTIEIHLKLFLDFLNKNQQQQVIATGTPFPSVDTRNASRRTAFEQDLEQILLEKFIDDRDWQYTSRLLLEFAKHTQNAAVRYTAYKVLWQELQATKLRYNPFNILNLYTSLHQVMKANFTFKLSTAENLKFTNLKREMRSAIIQRGAQILEGKLHSKASSNCYRPEFPLLDTLLIAIGNLRDASIYEEILAQLYDATEELEDQHDIALALNNISVNLQQNIIANVKYLNRANATQVHNILIGNIINLMNNPDFGKISETLRTQVFAHLPLSMRNLYTAKRICFRNVTDSNAYLYECPQTYLMCTNPRDLKKAAFYVEHVVEGGNQAFAFHSVYWSSRYIKMENVNTNGNSSTPQSAVTKNVYSRPNLGLWRVIYKGDFVLLIDTTMTYYLCAGNAAYWSGIEHHVYSRALLNEDFNKYEQECLWLAEDCSNDVRGIN